MAFATSASSPSSAGFSTDQDDADRRCGAIRGHNHRPAVMHSRAACGLLGRLPKRGTHDSLPRYPRHHVHLKQMPAFQVLLTRSKRVLGEHERGIVMHPRACHPDLSSSGASKANIPMLLAAVTGDIPLTADEMKRPLVRQRERSRLVASLEGRPGLVRWFHLGSQCSWIRQRAARLTISRVLTAAQLLELDHHVVPASQPGSQHRALSGDDPGPGPREPA